MPPANNTSKYEVSGLAALQKLQQQRDYHHHRGLEDRTHQNSATACRNYETFCQSVGMTAWPASWDTLSLFYTHYCVGLGYSVTSTYNIATALKNYSVQNNIQWLDEYTTKKLQRLRRGLQKARRQGPDRKCPLTLHRIIEMTLHADLGRLRDLQYLTIALMAHDGLFRFSEISRIQHQHVTWRSAEAIAITILHSKTTHTTCPEVAELSAYQVEDQPFSGVHLLRTYLQRLRQERGPPSPAQWLFPNLQSTKSNALLNKGDFIRWTRGLLQAAGHDPARYTGHSFRAGGATDLYAGGATPRHIQLAGRWKSEAYLIYIRDHPEAVAKDIGKAYESVIRCGLDIGRTT